MPELALGRLRSILDLASNSGSGAPLAIDDLEITITLNGYVQRRIRMEHGALSHQDPFFCRKLARQLNASHGCQAQRRIALLAVNVKSLFWGRIHLP